ncbi:MAG: hypothetical protein ACRELG_23830 [Gemmataceae bacterium]
MSDAWHGDCPQCRHRLHVHGRHTEGARLTCPGCRTPFTIPASAPPVHSAPRPTGGWGKRMAALSVIAGCLLLGVVTLVLGLWTGSGRKENPSSQRMTQSEPPRPEDPESHLLPEAILPPPPPRAETPDAPPVDDAPPPLPPLPTTLPPVAEAPPAKPESIKWLPPAEQAKVDRAIARGVAWLWQMQKDDGSWEDGRGFDQGGRTALAGLALLHSGVSSRDPAVRNAADYLRRKVADPRDETGAATTYRCVYVSALMILFLDRLGDRRDEDIIRTLSVAMIKGQLPSGKWTYSCSNLSADAERSVLDRLRKSRPVPPWELFNANGGFTESGSVVERGSFVMGEGDYSNTQFAVMGLWAAARHQVPPRQALARTVRRLRQTQAADGGWGYEDGKAPYLSMTAAALYGLAVGHGLTVADTKEAVRDPALDSGMKFLGKAIGNGFGPRRQVPQVVSLGDQFPFYSLWSLERTAVIYNARRIDGRDWYAWGAGRLLAAQNANGCWQSKGESSLIATPFALLFLSRADVAPELTRHLRYIEKEGRMVLVKTPDKSLQGMFCKRSADSIKSGVAAPSRQEKAPR